MSADILVMCADTEVLRFNFTEGIYDVLRSELLPYPLKGRLRPSLPDKQTYTKYEMTQSIAIARNNYNAVLDWLGSRTLPLSRKNAKWIYNLLKFEQVNTIQQRAKIAITCRAVSLLDNYWLKLDTDKTNWNSVNLRHNSLSEVIAQVALHGKSLTFDGSYASPELTTNGTYAKAWRRHEDGSLWLYKLGANGNTESRIEVMCSDLLDMMSVVHCHYEAGTDDGKYICMCPCMSNDQLSILPGMDFISWCNVNGKNPDTEMLRIDCDSIYRMWIVDYLLCNRDRHGQNWGFYYRPSNMHIEGCHPLFDHNNAFDIEYMKDREAPYQFGGMTTREAAKLAMSRVDFCFTEPITRGDFFTDRQYAEFTWRAKDLGIRTVSRYDALIVKEAIKIGLKPDLDRLKSMLSQHEVDAETLHTAMMSLI